MADKCGDCGKSIETLSIYRCDKCHVNAIKRQRAKRISLWSKGRCIYCGTKRAPGYMTCSKCKDKERERSATRRKEYALDSTICSRCGIKKHPEIDAGRATCINCREYKHKRRL